MSRFISPFQLRHRPPPRLSTPHEWRPLTEAELRFCWPVLEALCLHDRGRPAGMDLFGRFDACLAAACSGASWREVKVDGIRADTLHRTFRRWSKAGVWLALLAKLGREKPGLPALEYFLCRAYRRAWRMQGMLGILLARGVGLASALRAPFHRFPDPLLSARWHRQVIRPGLAALREHDWPWQRAFLRQARQLLTRCGGVVRVRRCWEPA